MPDYRYRPGELLVHADDCDAVTAPLAAAGYREAGGAGRTRLFTGGRTPVPDQLAALSSRRVSPNHLYTSDRIIWGSLRPRCTEDFLEDLPPLRSGDRVKVGVVDTGITRHDGAPHPYLDGRVTSTPEDIDPVVPDRDGNPTGSDGHGTFVAGLILREAPHAEVIMKGVVDRSTGDIEDLAVAHAITTLGEQGAQLINLSFSGHTWEDTPPLAIEDALLSLPDHVVVVAAAGNRGSTQVVYPAALTLGEHHAEVVAVGAAQVVGNDPATVATFSNHGPWVSAYSDGVDRTGPYFVPGYPTTCRHDDRPFTGWARWSGTSFAAATVTGRLAAVMAESRITAREAWAALKDEPEDTGAPNKIRVHHVNGEQVCPLVRPR
ncbi:S8/S53 family peptidase [Saccharothrix mutabilis subsp. mutabilis]|uniref:S8/S53 family peptidase n=1 Tax=Saccharothrix mutabilis subsp. mutabilis TaxID=66855 RepID=A0ABN0UG36_9PSEU